MHTLKRYTLEKHRLEMYRLDLLASQNRPTAMNATRPPRPLQRPTRSRLLPGGTKLLPGRNKSVSARQKWAPHGIALLLAAGSVGACGTDEGPDGSGTGAAPGTGAAASGGASSGGSPMTGGSSASGGSASDGSASGGVSPLTGGAPSGGAGSGGESSSGGNSTGGAAGGSGNGGTDGGGTGGAPACDASSAPALTRLGLETVVTSDKLNALAYAAQAPGSDDWYLVDILGYVWVASEGVVADTPFLDVSAEVQDLDFSYDERGLLSIAFAPDYESSGKFYVALVPTSTATANHDLVLEFTRSASDPLVADPETRKAIVDLPPQGQDVGFLNEIHNGSTVAFGPDGMLYIGMGDGGGQCNSAIPGAPQDLSVPHGKILRLDPSQDPPYAAAGNPFTDSGDPRVFHYGVRNPFRLSFDSKTGDLYFGDVGQWAFEEISHAQAGSAGLNFGWPAFEANEATPHPDCQTNTQLLAGSTHTRPIHTIAHGSAGGAANIIVAVVGGTVYRGTALPQLYGAYLFGEYYATRNMGALYQCGDQTSEVTVIRKECDANFPNDACFVPQGAAPALGEVGAIVAGHDGELYLPANNDTLLKIVPVP